MLGWLVYQQVPLDDYGVRWEAHLLEDRGGKPLLLSLQWARLRRVDGVMHLCRSGRLRAEIEKSVPRMAAPILDVCV